jgi:hypothetical protein
MLHTFLPQTMIRHVTDGNKCRQAYYSNIQTGLI